ncbi:MAG: hypothetical protein A2Y90_00600 [Chloroflexi bacterium RBG_13_52_12]|nr:MAG: hypothetical protein A2Y90_00600 [Chloroflexi bacterium RBG_13_52_12]
MKRKFSQVAKSLTGFSTPVFGISWNPPETDRDIIRKIITFLEDRRALYNPYDIEMPEYVARSIIEIRKELTEILKSIGDNPEISPHLRAMRAACRKYLDGMGRQPRQRYNFRNFDIFAALGELRGSMGIIIAQLAVKYGIDVEDELASIFPVEDK